MRIVAIGDIGVVDEMMHIGDEAMFEEFVDQARARGIDDIVGISSNPSETATRYGIESIARMGLEGDRAAMIERGERIVEAATGGEPLEPGDPATTLIEAIRDADGVIVTGAGNLASNWPIHIVERATIARIAAHFGKPFVITGQTLGPNLSPDDTTLLRGMLASAALVGVREGASAAVAAGLSIDATHTVDDASFLAIDREGVEGPIPAEPYCVVSLSTHVGPADRDEYLDRVASLLDSIVEHTGLQVAFFAHFGPLAGEPLRGDVRMHDEVARRMSSASTVVPTGDAAHAALLARSAELVVSSRYHPAVFAVAAGVPTLGIAVDDYTTVKLRGALGNFGQDGVLSVESLLAGEGPALAASLWQTRDAIRARAAELATARRRDSAAWWDRVVAALGG